MEPGNLPRTPNEILAEAVEQHRRGDLDGAITGYKKLLEQYPRHPDALHLLGLVYHQRGENKQAEYLMRRAIQWDPRQTFFHNHYGLVLQALSRNEDALAAFDAALEINPRFAKAHNNRGSALMRAGRLDEALASFDNAVILDEGYQDAHVNRAKLFVRLGLLDDAVNSCHIAIAINPRIARVHCLLGDVLRMQGKMEDALAAFDKSLKLDASDASVHADRGNVLVHLNRLTEARESYDRALALDPSHVAAHNNLGNLLVQQAKPRQALESFKKALTLNPGNAEVNNNFGAALRDIGQLDEAIAAFEQAIAFDSANFQAHSNRIMALHYREEKTDHLITAAVRQFAKQFVQSAPRGPSMRHRKPVEKLRIGYVSGDFREHPVGYFLEGVMLHHDRAEFEIYCYSHYGSPDRLTLRLQGHANQWRVIENLSLEAMVECIKKDEIDVLVDLSGHTAHNCLPLFARQPAPVQLTWLGYFGTTGLPMMDFILADRFVIREGEEHQFSEKVWRLPESYLCFTPPEVCSDIPSCCAEPNAINFASFNNLLKLSARTIKLWCRLLREVPGSCLLIRDKALADARVRSDLLSAFRDNGAPLASLRMESSIPREDYLRGYERVDISLSPSPFGGGTTTAEALWMGVPVVFLRGRTWPGRIGESILSTVGLPELVARDEEEYIQIAKALALDMERRRELRKNLRAMVQDSPLCDCAGFTRHLEQAYRGMWKSVIRKCSSH